MKIVLISLFCSIFLLLACASDRLDLTPLEQQQENIKIEQVELENSQLSTLTQISKQVWRLYDKETKVTCWIYSHKKAAEAGISCLKLED